MKCPKCNKQHGRLVDSDHTQVEEICHTCMWGHKH